MFSIVVFLQIKLSEHENKYLGFIIPALFVIISLIGVVTNIKTEEKSSGQEYRIVKTEDGREVRERVDKLNPAPDNSGSYLILSLLLNIPTLVLIIIYILIRRQLSKNNAEINYNDL